MKYLKQLSLCLLLLASGNNWAQYVQDAQGQIFSVSHEIENTKNMIDYSLKEAQSLNRNLNMLLSEMYGIDHSLYSIVPFKTHRGDILNFADRDKVRETLRELKFLDQDLDQAYREARNAAFRIEASKKNLHRAMGTLVNLLEPKSDAKVNSAQKLRDPFKK